MARRRLWLGVGVAVTLASTAAGQAPLKSDPGRELFVAYCGACHGVDAKGHGPAAPSLKVQPTDLTRLSARNEGRFPRLFVRESIVRGRAAHGAPDMPTWGPVFGAAGNGHAAARRLEALLAYIEDIQER